MTRASLQHGARGKPGHVVGPTGSEEAPPLGRWLGGWGVSWTRTRHWGVPANNTQRPRRLSLVAQRVAANSRAAPVRARKAQLRARGAHPVPSAATGLSSPSSKGYRRALLRRRCVCCVHDHDCHHHMGRLCPASVRCMREKRTQFGARGDPAVAYLPGRYQPVLKQVIGLPNRLENFRSDGRAAPDQIIVCQRSTSPPAGRARCFLGKGGAAQGKVFNAKPGIWFHACQTPWCPRARVPMSRSCRVEFPAACESR
jgi:hypothetical protein